VLDDLVLEDDEEACLFLVAAVEDLVLVLVREALVELETLLVSEA
jgi:hypothetical protein